MVAMVGKAIGWIFFITGVSVIIYLLLPWTKALEVDAIAIAALFAAPLVFLGTAIIVFNREE